MNASDRYRTDGAACLLDGRMLPVMNISVGGLFAVSDQPPMAGQVLSMELALPVRAQPLQIQGQVTWVNQDGKAAHLPRGFGIKITHISFVDKLALLGFLRVSETRGTHTRRNAS